MASHLLWYQRLLVALVCLCFVLHALWSGERTGVRPTLLQPDPTPTERLSRSPHGVWVAMDPVSKLSLTIDVGDRTLTLAQRRVHQVAQGLAPDCAPLFLTDGFREYLTAWGTQYGQWMPRPELLDAQGGKSSRRRRIVGVKHHVVFGALKTVQAGMAKRGWQINTAFVARRNLDFRQHMAALGRRVNTLGKHEAGLRHQLALLHVDHNFVWPHASLRQM